LQDLGQLSRIYGPESAQTIFGGGCVSKLFFPGLAPKVAKEISEMLGQFTQEVKNKNKSDSGSHGSTGETVSHISRSLLTPDEIRTLPSQSAIFIHGNKAPIFMKLTPAYKHKENSKFMEYSKDFKVKFYPTTSVETQSLDIDFSFGRKTKEESDEFELDLSKQPHNKLTQQDAELNERQIEIMTLCKKNKHISISDLKLIFPNVDERTLQRDLSDLVEKELLKSKGAKKDRHYAPS